MYPKQPFDFANRTGTVSFDRTDEAGSGPALKHPPRTCVLEKRGGSVVAHGCL